MQPAQIIKDALIKICETLELPLPEKLVIEAPKNPAHGDLSTNIALLLAKPAKMAPPKLAERIAAEIPKLCPHVAAVEVAGPGFCNIRFKPQFWQEIIPAIEQAKGAWGHSDHGHNRKVLVEYVSANPTGPLHVGHGRGAAVGDSVARILRASGYDVSTEYYLNDAGRQMRLLGKSIFLRARQLSGQEIDFPDECYKGEYIIDLAREVLREQPDLLALPNAEVICQSHGMQAILTGIKTDLGLFRCEHQRFFSEKSLVDGGAVGSAFQTLAKTGHSFEEDGALWFDSIRMGDDRNRVLKKSDGSLTYFATDIAYHHDKFERGYDWLIDIWGADHHGYQARMRGAIAAMGHDPEKFNVLLIQLVNLLENGTLISMSTRAGEFVTLAQLVEDVGVDAARFMFLSRSCDSPLDFDLELAKSRSMENPVYYVQYAHARICALHARAAERGLDGIEAESVLALLNAPEEIAILRQLAFFAQVVENAATALAPHFISRYLLDLAAKIHSYYGKFTILQADKPELSLARLRLLGACAQTLANGLFLLGVSAPETM